MQKAGKKVKTDQCFVFWFVLFCFGSFCFFSKVLVNFQRNPFFSVWFLLIFPRLFLETNQSTRSTNWSNLPHVKQARVIIFWRQQKIKLVRQFDYFWFRDFEWTKIRYYLYISEPLHCPWKLFLHHDIRIHCCDYITTAI